MISALLTLALKLSASGFEAPSQYHWFGNITLNLAAIWLGAAFSMVAQADPRRLNQYLPDLWMPLAVIAGVALIIMVFFAWNNW
jgi:hypothetical protein